MNQDPGASIYGSDLGTTSWLFNPTKEQASGAGLDPVPPPYAVRYYGSGGVAAIITPLADPPQWHARVWTWDGRPLAEFTVQGGEPAGFETILGCCDLALGHDAGHVYVIVKRNEATTLVRADRAADALEAHAAHAGHRPDPREFTGNALRSLSTRKATPREIRAHLATEIRRRVRSSPRQGTSRAAAKKGGS